MLAQRVDSFRCDGLDLRIELFIRLILSRIKARLFHEESVEELHSVRSQLPEFVY